MSEDPPRAQDGYRIAPLESLVRIQLITFRLNDRVDLEDLLEVGLVTPEVEETLPPDLRNRLTELKSTPE